MPVAKSFVNLVIERVLKRDTVFRVVDVGASGGIAEKWGAFGTRLWAVGFDPLVAEIGRLQALETRPKVRYESAFVGWPEFERVFSAAERCDQIKMREVQPYPRSSAVATQRIRQQNYARDVFNSGAPLEYSDRLVSLDQYFEGQPPPDFIKIDTDGSDYPVILGAQRLLTRSVLGLEVEMQFHGAVHEYGNTFSNIDALLRTEGFSLFELSPYRYSRSALPGPFLYDLPAQTSNGQIMWADAVYFRDLGHTSYDEIFGYRTTPEAALKLCCLFVLFGLFDCAAELLVTHPVLASLPERVELLNILTPTTFGRIPYHDYMARFEADPTQFFPSRLPLGVQGGRDVGFLAVPIAAATGIESLCTYPHWQGALDTHDDGVKLTTAPTPWSYAAEIAIDRSRITSAGPFRLRLELKVERGRIGIGALNDDGSDFIAERYIGARPCFVVTDLEIQSFDEVKQVIVRNAAFDDTPSEVVFKSIVLYELSK